MKRASFLCLVTLGVLTTTPNAIENTARAAQAGMPIDRAHALRGQGDGIDAGSHPATAATAISAKECRVYAHIRDNFVSKLESRRMKGRCSFDQLRSRAV